MQPQRRVAYGAVAAALLLAACGSQVPPREFVGAQGAIAAGQNPTAVGGSGLPVVPGATNSAGQPIPGVTSSNVVGGPGGGGNPGGGNPGGGNPGGGGATSSSAPGGSGGLPGPQVQAGSCAGFKNTTGITDSTITIANVADLSGPVPGLFKSAQAAVTAAVAYFNSTSTICGRKLKIEALDSGTSENGDQQAAQTACGDAFAMVGSLGAFDAGGAPTVEECGIPDLRTLSTEPDRYRSPVSYGVFSTAVPEVVRAPYLYYKKIGGDAYKHAAYVYLNAGAAAIQAQSFMNALRQLGYVIKDQIAIDVTSVPNYNGYVTQLKDDDIEYVQYTGAYQYAQRLKEAMYQQGYNPIFSLDPVAYDAGYVAVGKAVDGTYSFIPGPLFEEVDRNPKLATYIEWLQRTSGGPPTFFGVYAWASVALFTQLAIELGGKLSRSTLLTKIRGVHNYTNGGMFPPQDPGGKHTTRCTTVVQLVNGKWVRKTPYPYTCADSLVTGIGD